MVRKLSKGLLGKKLGCTQLFDEQGHCVGVSVIQAGPCVVARIRSQETDGYQAVQLGFEKSTKPLSKPISGQFAKQQLEAHKHLKEFYFADSAITLGQTLDVSMFQKDSLVDVRGISKGKGFQGTVKRHHFSRGPMTHGSKSHRIPGSSGSGTCPGVIRPGKRRAGHLGHEMSCVQNLKVMRVLPEQNILMVRGAIPGPNGQLVYITG